MTRDSRVRLAEEQLEVLADRIAVRLAAPRTAPAPMLTVEDLCQRFQVSRAWVYENSGRLGGVRLGIGLRAPLRFDPAEVDAALRRIADGKSGRPPAPERPARRRGRKYVHPVYDG